MAATTVDLPVLKWDGAKWADVTGRVPVHDSPAGEYTALSWNVWFHGYGQTRDAAYLGAQWLPRQRALLAEMRSANSTFLCLQEVTAPRAPGANGEPGQSFLELLLAEDWVRDSFYVSDATGSTFRTWYGVVVLSRIPIQRFVAIPFQSQMGRVAIVGHVNTSPGGESMAVATAHLESPVHVQCKRVRVGQLQAVMDYFRQCGVYTGLFMGDFNVDNPKEMEAAWSTAGWRDLNDGKSTWFSHRWRPDRVIMMGPAYDADPAEVLGTGPSGVSVKGPDGTVRTPSDHFALKATLTRRIDVPPPPPPAVAATLPAGGAGTSWSLQRTLEVVGRDSPFVYSTTRNVTEAVAQLGQPDCQWKESECYVYSDYKGAWYKLWKGEDGWNLQHTYTMEEVNDALVYKGTQVVGDAVGSLNNDPTLWSGDVCYVYSVWKGKWYKLWKG